MFVDFRHGTVGEVAPTLQAKDQGGYSLNYLPGVLTWVEVGRTLNSFENCNDGRATMLVTYPIQDGRGMDKKQNGLGVGGEDDPSYTIDATGGQSVAVVQTVLGDVAHTLTNEGHDASEDGSGRGTPVVSFYSTGGSMNGFAQEGDVSVTVTVGSSLGVPSPPADALPDLVVRRLTPVETERLQGLPDDHTRWKVDEKTGSTVEQSDSARYKQCGNGLAVPVMQWIVDGILALIAEEEGS
jgi:DNA (cytosine-5)-methyltransferase 1